MTIGGIGMRLFTGAMGILATAFMGATAHAASLSLVEGRAMIDSGRGFEAAGRTQSVAPGARILLEPGAKATLVYADNCRQSLRPTRVWQVLERSPCEFESHRSSLGSAYRGSMKDTATWDPGAGHPSADGALPPAAPGAAAAGGAFAGVPAGLMIGGFAIVVGGAVAAAVAIADDAPASP